MEFQVERAAFAEAVAWAARALPARTPVPVLGGLLLKPGGGRLTVSGFDFEAAARIEVDAATTGTGQVLVLGRRLLDICRVLQDGLDALTSFETPRLRLELLGSGQRALLSAAGEKADSAHRHLLMSVKQLV